jgi:beta-ureidopropionase / N-carbamoyl-L-amino-acid hydrolase
MVLAMSINRRELVSGLTVATVAAAFPSSGFPQGSASGLRINPDRLRGNLEGLSVYGRPEGGTFADGVTRDGFSDACVAGRNYAMRLMRGSGMEPHIDPASNIFGSRAGSAQSLKPILFGSHIDSVPSGGNFDGDLGSMSAIEVMHTLKEHGVTTRHPLQMVIWTDEENTFAGSGSAAKAAREMGNCRGTRYRGAM